MAQWSLLSQYSTVAYIPDDLLRLRRKMKTSNACSLLSFLIGNLPTVVLGERYHQERIIRLREPIWWEIDRRHGRFRHEVPSFSVDSAITALNARLKDDALPYRVGRRCHNGDPRSSKFQPVAPYIIGLADIRRPLVQEPASALRAVNPVTPRIAS